MLITRASRRDRDDIKEFYERHDWDLDHLDVGTALIARRGGVIGTVRLIEISPSTVVLEDVLVDRNERGGGVGRQLIQAALNSRGGEVYLCCHPDALAFYEGLGGQRLEFDELPDRVQQHMRDDGAWPTRDGHVHHFVKLR